jgi:predicted AAA+ superfamily ATPase
VARTLYLGSAPTIHTSRRGLDDRSIKLGCVQPGESVATFGDALRRLTDEATHLYVDGRRYWLSTQPSVTRPAQDRAAQQDCDDVWAELTRRLRADRARGDFAAVHVGPVSSADVPDEMEARLVLLSPEHPHTARSEDSPARRAAAEVLDRRGTGQQIYRNMLAFLAPDKTRLAELEQALRQHMAWRSIDEEREQLNLDAFQSNQARTKCEQADDAVKARILETYSWLLVPTQPDPQGAVEWQELRVQGRELLAVRAGRKLKTEELLITGLAATRLRYELDRALWSGCDHVGLKQLWE